MRSDQDITDEVDRIMDGHVYRPAVRINMLLLEALLDIRKLLETQNNIITYLKK